MWFSVFIASGLAGKHLLGEMGEEYHMSLFSQAEMIDLSLKPELCDWTKAQVIVW